MAINLTKDFTGIPDYEAKHNENYTLIESEINNLLVALGASSGASIAISDGLREIFDRDGVVGIASYLISNGTLTSSLLPVAAGAVVIGTEFRKTASAQNVNLTGLADGTLYLDVGTDGNPSASASQTANSIYSFSWVSGSQTVSNVTLLVDVLFDGNDYNDQLDSTNLGLTFTSAAARFEEIESRLGILGMFYAQDVANTSANVFGFFGGKVRNDNVVVDTADGTVAIVSSDTNYIELTPSTGVVTANQSGFTSLRIPLFIATTNALGAITSLDDRRTWAAIGGGGGGGHAQNTDTGTSGGRFDLRLGQASGSANASFGVDRGSDPTVEMRWNETTNQWEFTNDGTNYQTLGGLNLGAQEQSRLVMIEDPPQVLEALNISTGGGYTQVDLTNQANILADAPQGVAGLILRVQYWDDAPTASTNLKLREPENALASPATAYSKWAEETGSDREQDPSTIILEGEGLDIGSNRVVGFEYLATASGAGTAHVRVFLLGFFAKVTGVGTQDTDFVPAVINVNAASAVNSNLTSFVNRGLMHKFRIEETSGNPTGGYDVLFYARDTFLAADVLYELSNVDPATAFEDFLPVWVEDKDNTAELHVRIENNDGAQNGTYQITIDIERFA